MEIIIKGEQEEIAALVLAVQRRRKKKDFEAEHPSKGRIITTFKNGRMFKERMEC